MGEDGVVGIVGTRISCLGGRTRCSGWTRNPDDRKATSRMNDYHLAAARERRSAHSSALFTRRHGPVGYPLPPCLRARHAPQAQSDTPTSLAPANHSARVVTRLPAVMLVAWSAGYRLAAAASASLLSDLDEHLHHANRNSYGMRPSDRLGVGPAFRSCRIRRDRAGQQHAFSLLRADGLDSACDRGAERELFGVPNDAIDIRDTAGSRGYSGSSAFWVG